MARVDCSLCGGKVDTTKSNYIYANNLHQHKKCAKKSILTDKEKTDLRALTDAIKWVADQQQTFLAPAQWRMITAQIKKLVDDGYDYEQQLRAFKWYFDKGNQYMGYGIVAFIIEDALNDDIVEKVSVDNAKLLREKMEQRRKERSINE